MKALDEGPVCLRWIPWSEEPPPQDKGTYRLSAFLPQRGRVEAPNSKKLPVVWLLGIFLFLKKYLSFYLFVWLHQVLVAALRIFSFHGSMQDLLVAACDLLVVACRKSHGQRSLAGYSPRGSQGWTRLSD